jgi:hypothetical protein
VVIGPVAHAFRHTSDNIKIERKLRITLVEQQTTHLIRRAISTASSESIVAQPEITLSATLIAGVAQLLISASTVTLQLLDRALQNEVERTDKDLDSEMLIQLSTLEETPHFRGLVLAHSAWVPDSNR